MNKIAFEARYNAAKNRESINNNYPYIKGNYPFYMSGCPGYKGYKPENLDHEVCKYCGTIRYYH
jgi:hypothetical protein